jgi:hypothetical protein
MSTDNKDKKAEEVKEQPKEVQKKVREVVKDAEVLKLLEEDEDDFE